MSDEKIADAFQAGIDSFKRSDAKLEVENVGLRKELDRTKRRAVVLELGDQMFAALLCALASPEGTDAYCLRYGCGEIQACNLDDLLGCGVKRLRSLWRKQNELKEDIRFLLKCIVGDPTEGMGLERDDPVRVHFRARLDAIREKVK